MIYFIGKSKWKKKELTLFAELVEKIDETIDTKVFRVLQNNIPPPPEVVLYKFIKSQSSIKKKILFNIYIYPICKIS